MKRNDLVGQTFGRLTVTALARIAQPKQNVVWACLCVCGKTAEAFAYDLKAGKVKSCGCLVKEGLHKTHGMAGQGKKRSSTYNVWAAVLQRCNNPNEANYKNYGGRGIAVTERWKSFEAFYADMGERPAGLTLERLDNNKGYDKDNCAWLPPQDQARNKRNNVWVQIEEERLIFVDALKKVGYDKANAYATMKRKNLTHQEVLDKWQKQKNDLSKTK